MFSCLSVRCKILAVQDSCVRRIGSRWLLREIRKVSMGRCARFVDRNSFEALRNGQLLGYIEAKKLFCWSFWGEIGCRL